TRDRDWLKRFIVAPDKARTSGDPIALALRAKYKQVVMPSLDLGTEDANALIDYIDRQSRAVREAAGTSGETTAAAAAGRAGGANRKPIVDPYVRIRRALDAGSLGDSGNVARSIAAEAGK